MNKPDDDLILSERNQIDINVIEIFKKKTDTDLQYGTNNED